MKGRREQLTVRLEPQVMQAAKQRSNDMKMSLSAAVAEAAKESLLSSYRSKREQEILKAVDRNFYALRRFERQVRLEMAVLKEMVGVGMRSFFNHTTPIPEVAKNAALRSGKERFHRYLDLLAANLRSGDSILRDVPLPDSSEQHTSAVPVADSGPSKAGTPNSKDHVTASRDGPVNSEALSRSGATAQQDRGLFEPDGEGD